MAHVISASGPTSSYQINVNQVFFEMIEICPGGAQCHFAATKLEDILSQKTTHRENDGLQPGDNKPWSPTNIVHDNDVVCELHFSLVGLPGE